MIQVLHISAECYPAAKTGGLGDVVGSLPKYLTKAGINSAAVLPKYGTKWISGQEWEVVHGGAVRVDWRHHGYTVQKLKGDALDYPLFVVDVPGLFDRPGIYADPFSGYSYGDEVERYLVFQQAVLQWLRAFPQDLRPKMLHCHDHHTGLIPFMVNYCPEYQELARIPNIFTIHNGQYQGWFSWDNQHLLPYFESRGYGLLDWKGVVNPMAAAVKTAWAVTTVSQSYLYELHESSLGLEPLFQQEWRKQHGIVNGIDAAVWDPENDEAISHPLVKGKLDEFKQKNKRQLCEWFGFDPKRPLVSFIGRMVKEKGVDLLPDVYRNFLSSGSEVSFLVLGTGESWTENEFRGLAHHFQGKMNAVIDYNEALAHQIYAGSDFLIMPSRVEPCGLNQMYAMRYGTVPIVRSIGGLKDTVPDIAEANGVGRGIRFNEFSVEDCHHAIHRAVSMYYNDPDIFKWLRNKVTELDFSWEKTISVYLDLYRSVGAELVTVQKPEPKAQKPPKAAAKPAGKTTKRTNKPATKRTTTTKSTAKKTSSKTTSSRSSSNKTTAKKGTK